MMEINTDETLMALVATGNKEAFGIITQKYLKMSVMYAKKFALVEPEEDEIVQDTFLRIWKYAYKFNPSKGSFKTWFFSILIRTSYSYLSKNKCRNNSCFLDDIPDNLCNIENILVQKQESSILMQKIMKLNTREQQVILLTYYEGLSNKETAENMKTTIKAIETLLVRAKKKLKKFIGSKANG